MRSTQQVSFKRALGDWLTQRSIPAYDAYRADRSRGIELEDVRAMIGKRSSTVRRMTVS